MSAPGRLTRATISRNEYCGYFLWQVPFGDGLSYPATIRAFDVNDHRSNSRVAPLILLVDDSINLLDGWTALLEHAGFRVATAVNGAIGFSVAQQLTPDLIITDLLMPEMHGLALCRALKSSPAMRSIPVILCTACPVKIDEQPFELFLPKPVLLEQFLREIETLLSR